MRVLVAGGGIGGLALAAGLRRRAVDVRVFERDTDLSATGGYHITLDEAAQAALEQLVPQETFTRLLASAAANRLRDRDVIRDMRGRTIGHAPVKSTDTGIDVDRVTLRLLLAEAVDEDLVTGAVCSSFERDGDRVVLRLESGEVESGDLLVGADGVHSVIAQTLAGGPTNQPAGLIGVCGRTPASRLDGRARERLGDRSGLSIGPRGSAVYVGYLDPVGHAVLDAPELRSSKTTEPTYIWGVMLTEGDQTAALRGLVDEPLTARTLEILRSKGWSDDALEVVRSTEPRGVAFFRFHAGPADPKTMAPWPAGPVTALGDAVHAVPPTAGNGAGIAIRDAADLVTRLDRVSDGTATLPVAVRAFEEQMRERGAAVVRQGMKPVAWVRATDSLVGATVTRTLLPAMAALTTLRHQPRSSRGT